jgi:hypothetical protein
MSAACAFGRLERCSILLTFQAFLWANQWSVLYGTAVVVRMKYPHRVVANDEISIRAELPVHF